MVTSVVESDQRMAARVIDTVLPCLANGKTLNGSVLPLNGW
jgi:hypothetical protein